MKFYPALESIFTGNASISIHSIESAYTYGFSIGDYNFVRNVKPSDSVEKRMTILFSDIRNFTSITNKMDAKESFKLLNDIFSEIAHAISSNQGFVDKFIGGCVMAIFPESPLDFAKAGIEILESLKKLNEKLEIPINIGVGLAYGSVMIGTLGYEKRLDATLIISTINTAYRMEYLTKILCVSIVITKEIQVQIESSSDLICYSLGSFYLKGQDNSKEMFEVIPTLRNDIKTSRNSKKESHCLKKKNSKKQVMYFSDLKKVSVDN